MTYEMTVIIQNPQTEEGKNSDMLLRMTATFAHDPETYGNGYTLVITNNEDKYQNVYDLRYNTDFNSKRKIAWLAAWAENYWNGENGAYRVKDITISRV